MFRTTIAALFALLLLMSPALADGACTTTAQFAFNACKNEVKDDTWGALAVCLNYEDDEEFIECRNEALMGRFEAHAECDEIKEARLELCEALGEDPYDPDWDPADFDSDFASMATLNDYFPLAIGNVWEYEGGDETITVTVMDKTKLIDGVTCIVVNDVVAEDGQIIEDTDDWYAHGLDGTVHYCGELARDYEWFEGDNPMEAELVEIEGSFKAGRDGAKSGILMMAMPMVDTTYRQEWALGDAEDAAEVLSVDYSYGEDPDLDQFVPQELAELLCDGDCVVTRDFTPLEPDVEERKYYAPGIGTFLEVNVEEGEIVELVGCNFHPACAAL
jgi:hypothetical protein